MELEENDYNPKLYIKSDWEPPNAEPDIEDMLDNFFDNFDSERNNCTKKIGRVSNLTRHKKMILNWLRTNREIIVLMAIRKSGHHHCKQTSLHKMHVKAASHGQNHLPKDD